MVVTPVRHRTCILAQCRSFVKAKREICAFFLKKLCSPSRLYIQLIGGAPYKMYFLYGCFGNCRCYSRWLCECPFLYLGSSQTKKVILYNWIYRATLHYPFLFDTHKTTCLFFFAFLGICLCVILHLS